MQSNPNGSPVKTKLVALSINKKYIIEKYINYLWSIYSS